MCDSFPPAGYWLTYCKEKVSGDSAAQLNNILSLGVYQISGKARPETDSASEVASICCLHRIGLSREERAHDWDQLDLTGERCKDGETSEQERRERAVWSCKRETHDCTRG